MRNKSFYFKNGSKAVLLFHAFSGSPNDVRIVGRSLERSGYTVYAPVFSGHGTDDPADVLKGSAEIWYEDAKEALRFLKEEGHDDIAVFGLSMGGMMAVRLLLDFDLLGGGTFASPVTALKNNRVAEKFWPYFKMTREKAGEEESVIRQEIETLMPRLKEVLEGLDTFVQQMASEYHRIHVPVLIAQGGQDEIIDPDTSFRFAEALTQTKVDFHWYEDGPHVLTVGPTGNELQKDVAAFLENLDWDGGKEWI